MQNINEFKKKIFQISSPEEFEENALQLFYYQSVKNPIYREYLRLLGRDYRMVKGIDEIPFLPVELFKTNRVQTGTQPEEVIFSSSGTSGQFRSKHYVSDLGLYQDSFTKGFVKFYGDPRELCIIALLPSYLEREGSSLVYMADQLIEMTSHPDSGFYLNKLEELSLLLKRLHRGLKPVILLGVSFALLDLAEQFPGDYSSIVFMETGGMKGRKEELTRKELHDRLKDAFQVEAIHSEYGMTELLSQAYSKGEGCFFAPPWMKILIRDADDPFSRLAEGRSGGVDVIDLANLNSCAFISTQDLGKLHPDGSFEVLGRFDQSDVRGCNLLLTM